MVVQLMFSSNRASLVILLHYHNFFDDFSVVSFIPLYLIMYHDETILKFSHSLIFFIHCCIQISITMHKAYTRHILSHPIHSNLKLESYLREASHIDFVHDKRHVDVGGWGWRL